MATASSPQDRHITFSETTSAKPNYSQPQMLLFASYAFMHCTYPIPYFPVVNSDQHNTLTAFHVFLLSMSL